jgi:hypothetical protein
VLTCSACSFATSPMQFDLDWQNKRNIPNQAIPGLTAQGMLDPASRFSKNSGEIGTGHFCVLLPPLAMFNTQTCFTLGDVLHVPSTCDHFEGTIRNMYFGYHHLQSRPDQTRRLSVALWRLWLLSPESMLKSVGLQVCCGISNFRIPIEPILFTARHQQIFRKQSIIGYLSHLIETLYAAIPAASPSTS